VFYLQTPEALKNKELSFEQLFNIQTFVEGKLALLTHHDALPSTGFFNVTIDYINQADEAYRIFDSYLSKIIDSFTQHNIPNTHTQFVSCPSNRTCEKIDQLFQAQDGVDDVILALYNP
jgi:hypothetical protein